MKVLPLTFRTKLAYGLGELGTVIPVSIAVFFLLYFLTDVAGLNPALAGAVLLVGRGWDAINDPLIGWLSDRTHSAWGRRYPWMIYGAVPLALGCTLQWIVPPISSQWGLFAYYTLLSLLVYAAFSAVQLPFAALAAELAQDYDQRTQLMGIKAGFNIVGSVVGLVLAQVVFASIADVPQRYVTIGWLSSLAVLLGIGLCVWGTYSRYWAVQSPTPVVHRSFWTEVPSLWHNSAFRWLMGLNLCSLMGIQVTAAMLPYFVSHWMRLPAQHFTQMAIVVQVSAVLTMPLWMKVAQQTSKRIVYFCGAPLAFVALAAMSWVQPGQLWLMYGFGVMIGVGLSTFYLVPLAMLPDVIAIDAIQTGQRREGLFFSFLVFFQKVSLAIALFIVGRLLDRTGFIGGETLQVQPVEALWAIRLMMGLFPALLILGGLYCAYRYPITRQQLQIIRADSHSAT
ncbi:MFS transporter [filamentous cyanobacterium LEGE 11480]|uniref:MFS transporter n=1 Tax=Romeriopsis navalis LEGE 11480 TaxID=2777977 RepID=A0A928Z1Q6_9CYAN|nr:MFS transporter [Romeriopsis navalis]MBE9029596.1 MFS transporter [Romeriopsis navalis LEGE 11480]